VTGPDPLADLLGSSPAFAGMKDRARQMLARAKAGGRLPPVLIQGETGTGKGLLARALHQASPRAAGPFIAVNCGAIPETLGESEFFGFAPGAHSEARHGKIGFFQAADRGSIFLDEVGLLSEGHQARLLKVVEDRQVVRVGSTRPVPVDLWVISATNADLRADVEQHKFRRDLYERLAVITFTLPPLRERADDIVPLAERFLARSCAEYELRPKRLAPDAQRRLREHPWPGNVRELSNVIERAALLVESQIIPASGLELASPLRMVAGPPPARPSAKPGDRRERIQEALERQGGNITRTAADLGVSRKTLRDWMRQHGLYPGPVIITVPGENAAGQDRTAEGSGPAGERDETASGRHPAAVPAAGPLPLPDSSPAAPASNKDIHWERRWITLLRVSLSPENDDRIGDATRPLEIIADKIQTFGGAVIELGRTSLEAAFGLDPLENAAQRAAYAALAIQRAGARARGQPAPILVPRIALHADSYLVGRMGSLTRIDQDAKEAASTLLAALVRAAPPDSTVVSQTTLPFLRRRFDFDWPVAAGIAGEAHRLLGRAERPAFDAQVSSFVGRESEIELLEDRFDLAAEGHGQIVGIVGDPGVGKSRLVWEFLHGGTRDRGLVLETASVALGRPTPFLAIIELLRTCFGVDAGEADAAIRTKVTRHLADLDPSLAGSLPAFLSLLDVPTGDTAWEGLHPTRRRQRTFDAIKRLMLRESERQRLVLLFEDAHWADSETKALLDAVADSLPVARVLMLVTFRPEYEHGWGNRTFYTQIRVDPLRGEGARRFLRDLLGEHPSMDSLRARLIEWTGGNPFFLEETVRTLAETKALEGERGAYRLTEPVAAIAVPNTVHEVLAARMARLAPLACELLQAAAVVGRRVPHEVLAAVSLSSAEGLDQGLELLQAREFLSDTGLAEEREYAFRHALTQEVAYASLPEEQRRVLHGRILHAIERVYADRLDDKLGELVHHALEARRWEEAVKFLYRAGTRALAQSANTEAAACFERALVALSHLPDQREHQELAIDLRFGLRNALTPLGQVQRTLEHLREAEKLAALLGDDHRRGRALSFAANCLCLIADYEGAIEASQRARAHAKSLGDFPLSVAAGMYLGRAHAGLGEYRRAADVLHEVAASIAGERVHDYLGLPVLPAVFARSHLVLALAELGEFDEAERFIKEAIEIAEGAHHPDTLLWAHTSAGIARLVRGQLAPATSALERAQEIYRAADIPVYFPLFSSPLGLAYAMAGRIAEGLVLAEQAVQKTESRRQVALLPWTLLRLGEVRLLAGQLPGATDAASRALGLFREHRERGGEAYALRLLGEVEGRQDGAGQDERLIAEAHRLAEDLGMRPLAARCRLCLGLQPMPSERGCDPAAQLVVAAQAFKDLGMEYWARVAEHAAAGPR
jgi:transcriptional regulator with AAA-type ATPase domain/tetratricopeptide (TPR) repeat protein